MLEYFAAGTMDADRPHSQLVLKAGALLVVVAAIGMPINHMMDYGLLLAAALVICCGTLVVRPSRWLIALSLVATLVAGRAFLATPRIEEGHNIFLVDGDRTSVLEAGLPGEVFLFMRNEFDAEYPIERRCDAKAAGCWRGNGFPDRVFAFSSDGVLDRPAFSRRVRDIDFSDPNWLGLGFANDVRYDWYSNTSDIARAKRDRRTWKVFGRWQFAMPWFVMYRIPPPFVGSQLCWRGDVLWEGTDQHFQTLAHETMSCRTVASSDVGQRIFGVAIRSDRPLAMRLDVTSKVAAWRLAEDGAAILAVATVLALLVKALAWRSLVLPVVLIALALVVVVLNDVTFIGGLRPQDGGDDGLQYDSFGRTILHNLAAGNIALALRGGDDVFYAVPGIRYFRALEHLVFGETNLGYLSVVLALPFVVLALLRRFLPACWAIATTLIFVAVPVGLLVGSSYVQYVKWAARGFADPLAAFAFLAGLVLLIPPRHQSDHRSGRAFAAALMFALAVFVRPNLAPGVGIILAGGGLSALFDRAFGRLIGLCLGFAFVLVMPAHNYTFGATLLPFSANATLPQTLVMPPSAWAAATLELLHLDFAHGHVAAAVHQIVYWLAGPGEFVILVPINAALIAILAWLVIAGRAFDPWLRLLAAAALALHAVALFYTMIPRYHLLTWLLTLVVSLAWLHERGIPVWRKRFPTWSAALQRHRLVGNLASLLAGLEAASAPRPPALDVAAPTVTAKMTVTQ